MRVFQTIPTFTLSSSQGVQSTLIIITIAWQFFITELMQNESTLKNKNFEFTLFNLAHNPHFLRVNLDTQILQIVIVMKTLCSCMCKQLILYKLYFPKQRIQHNDFLRIAFQRDEFHDCYQKKHRSNMIT